MHRTNVVNRRQLLSGAAALGVVAAMRPAFGFAQAATPASAATVSANATLAAGEAGWTKFNLNTASNDQFSIIPGVGDQMLREFNEYRPYATILAFRKEIGKYVDASVVAGYEAYLYVPVDPNNADADTLKQLPGVDDDKAQALLSAQPFADDAAFLAALGQQVSAEQAALAPAYLASSSGTEATWVRFNLNTATNDQFSTIPGVGDQMLREFNEYRPYTTILQFRKEIGKYVDASVVAGYEAYLFVPVDPNNADADTFKQLPGVDDDKAQALTSARPFADNATFVAALGGQVSAEQAALAAAYLT